MSRVPYFVGVHHNFIQHHVTFHFLKTGFVFVTNSLDMSCSFLYSVHDKKNL